uniref:Uncharacterized protein n=1 Tax=Cannabis sativa TaxID=3483 RepID=A0A803PYH5_CANSA
MGFFELVIKTPRRPIGHVGTSAQGETLDTWNTTITLGNRASTKQTPGVETSKRESAFEQEPERVQARGRQPMGPPPDVE